MILAASLLASCAKTDGDTAAELDLREELTEPGGWSVGYTQTELSYADPHTGEARALRLAAWYPTEDSGGDDASYFLGSIDAPGVQADAAPAEGPFPLVVFSHGHTGYAENSAFLMEHLTSHGFVVVAPDHTGNTILDGDERETAIYLQRPGDISATLDAALEGALATPPITDDVFAIGHSFGGYTLHALAGAGYDEALIEQCLDGSDTSSYCSTMTDALADALRGGFPDPRIRAYISMAPGDYRLYGEGLSDATGGPVMLMTGDMDDRTGPDADAIWAALGGGDNLHVRTAGGGHQTYTDYSGILESFEGLIEPEEGWRITNAYALAWLRRHLGDDSAEDLLDGTLTVSDAAELVP